MSIAWHDISLENSISSDILGMSRNFLNLRSSFAGTVFPSTPIQGQEFYYDLGSNQYERYMFNGLSWQMEVDNGYPIIHVARHLSGGVDVISVQGLSGQLAMPQVPITHKTTHEGGSDPITLSNLGGTLGNIQVPSPFVTPGGRQVKVETVTASVLLTVNQNTLFVNATSGAVVLTLPNPSTCPGAIYLVKKTDVSVNFVSLYSTALIDGLSIQSLSVQYASLILLSNGTSWCLFGV